MANPKLLKLLELPELKDSKPVVVDISTAWNHYREQNPFLKIDLSEADLTRTYLPDVDFIGANLKRVNLSGVMLVGAKFRFSDLSEANLRGANLLGCEFCGANLSGADFTGANLINSNLSGATVSSTKISNCNVYSVNVWDIKGDFGEQKDLIITPKERPVITVDNIEVAQFVYLILNNKKIRNVIDTLTSKTVLILGSFSPERKVILDVLRNKLREYDLLPIMFDFDRPIDRNTIETIQTLAGLSYFIIADVTQPKQVPLELQVTIPDLQVPCVPIIAEGETPFFAMLEGLRQRDWVLDTISYDSLETLLEILKPHIIDPAIKKHDELRLLKAKIPTVISGRELKKKKL